MKRIAFAIVSISFVLAFTGCAWKVPEKISVKTKADYNFSLGNYEKDLGEEMSMSSMMGDTGNGNEAIATFDYFPGKEDKNTQHYLLKVEILRAELISASAAEAAFTAANATSLEIGNGLTITPPPAGKTGLDFNPSTILSGMAESLGSGVGGKIAFSEVPLYLYCEAVPGVTATATMAMFYGDKPAAGTPITERANTRQALLDGDTISHVPLPQLETDEDSSTIITNLAETTFLGSQAIDVKDVINHDTSDLQENDQLCIDYSITNIQGTVSKADAINGITLKLYAFIDLPLKFDVTDDIALDLSSMTGDDNSASETAASEASNAAESTSDSEFSKYLEAVESISIKYVAFQLPFYSNYGMELGVDLIGDGYTKAGLSVVDENKTLTEADKSVITLPYTTVLKVKEGKGFEPKFSLFMAKDSVFSIPREKGVKLKIELNLKTDGLIQIQ